MLKKIKKQKKGSSADITFNVSQGNNNNNNMGISFCGKNNKGRIGADTVPANITYKLILYADGEPRPLLGPEQAAQTWLPERQTNSISFLE